MFFFKLTTNQKFDIAIMSVIMMNMIAMALEHYGQTEEFSETLAFVNTVFISVFTVECLLKIIGLRWYYFKEPWNVFDFIVVVLSILGYYLISNISLYSFINKFIYFMFHYFIVFTFYIYTKS